MCWKKHKKNIKSLVSWHVDIRAKPFFIVKKFNGRIIFRKKSFVSNISLIFKYSDFQFFYFQLTIHCSSPFFSFPEYWFFLFWLEFQTDRETHRRKCTGKNQVPKFDNQQRCRTGRKWDVHRRNPGSQERHCIDRLDARTASCWPPVDYSSDRTPYHAPRGLQCQCKLQGLLYQLEKKLLNCLNLQFLQIFGSSLYKFSLKVINQSTLTSDINGHPACLLPIFLLVSGFGQKVD